MADGIIDGTWDLVAETPLGKQRGSAVLSTDGGRVSARIDMGSLGRDTLSGTCEGASFTTRGERRQFPFGKVAYEIAGRVEGDVLSAKLTSKVANISITGTRR